MKILGNVDVRPSSPLVVLLAAFVACVPDGTPAPKPAPATTVAPAVAAAPVAPAEPARADSAADAEVDSLMAAAHRSPGLGAPFPGEWSPTRRVTEERFTLDAPTQAVGAWDRRDPATPRFVVSKLPECVWSCSITVTLRGASSLDSVVHAETHPEKAGGNAEAADYAATLLDTLPVSGARAAHLQRYCGDCSTYAILVASRNGIAEIEYSLDDRERGQDQLAARLETVARTFRWR